MEEKRRRGRPPGQSVAPRKDAVPLFLKLARDCAEIADQHAPDYGSRTAAIEALIRLAHARLVAMGLTANNSTGQS